MKVTKSSGNVFEDLGFPDPETHALKAALVYRIDTLIKKNGFTQKLPPLCSASVSPMFQKCRRDSFARSHLNAC